MADKVIAPGQLLGAWSLVSWKIFSQSDALATEPFGSHPNGQLQYTADGWMSAVVCSATREALPAGTSPRRMSPELLAESWRSYFHYSGSWRIEGDSVIHGVQLALNPNMVGTEQVRQMQLDGNTLTLTGIENLGQQQRRHVLLWQRAEIKETSTE